MTDQKVPNLTVPKLLSSLQSHAFVLTLPTAQPPTRATCYAAAYDLYAAQEMLVKPGAQVRVPTGVKMVFLPGWYGQIASRSGLAIKFGVVVEGGVIDRDYPDPVDVIVHNTNKCDYLVKTGDRIAQLLILRVAENDDSQFVQVTEQEYDQLRKILCPLQSKNVFGNAASAAATVGLDRVGGFGSTGFAATATTATASSSLHASTSK